MVGPLDNTPAAGPPASSAADSTADGRPAAAKAMRVNAEGVRQVTQRAIRAEEGRVYAEGGRKAHGGPIGPAPAVYTPPSGAANPASQMSASVVQTTIRYETAGTVLPPASDRAPDALEILEEGQKAETSGDGASASALFTGGIEEAELFRQVLEGSRASAAVSAEPGGTADMDAGRKPAARASGLQAVTTGRQKPAGMPPPPGTFPGSGGLPGALPPHSFSTSSGPSSSAALTGGVEDAELFRRALEGGPAAAAAPAQPSQSGDGTSKPGPLAPPPDIFLRAGGLQTSPAAARPAASSEQQATRASGAQAADRSAAPGNMSAEERARHQRDTAVADFILGSGLEGLPSGEIARTVSQRSGGIGFKVSTSEITGIRNRSPRLKSYPREDITPAHAAEARNFRRRPENAGLSVEQLFEKANRPIAQGGLSFVVAHNKKWLLK